MEGCVGCDPLPPSLPPSLSTPAVTNIPIKPCLSTNEEFSMLDLHQFYRVEWRYTNTA